MNYIKVNDGVQVAGLVANEDMLKDGYFLFEGEIPKFDPETQKLEYIDSNLVVVELLSQSEQLEKTKKEYIDTIQSKLDEVAQGFGFDNMMSARSYSGFESIFQAQAIKLSRWCSDCWVYAEGILKSGEMPESVEEFIEALPTLES